MSAQVVVVGSSPLLLVRAIELARDGAEVSVLERSQVVGGSWTVTAAHGWTEVETACHVLERDRAMYERMQRAGASLEPMTPAPVVQLSSRFTLPYGSRRWSLLNVALTPLGLWRAARRADRGERWQVAWRATRARLVRARGDLARAGLRREPIRYFTGGVAGMHAGLARMLEDLGGRLELGATAARVHLAPGARPRVLVEPGGVREVDHLVTGDGFGDLEIVADGAGPALRPEVASHRHLLLAVTGVARPISYLHAPYDRLVHRVTDITGCATAGPIAVGQHLLLVQLRRPAEPEEVREVLVRWRVLPGSAVVEAVQEITLHSSRLDLAEHDRAQLRAQGLEVLRSHGDLVGSLRNNPPSPLRAP